MFKRILIANRGEIAVRVIRACREMGITAVAVYSEADRDALHVRLADQAWAIGPPAARESYLSIERILLAAKASQADAIHPGYGFLSENPLFPEACEKGRIVFIGPGAEAMRLMGNKVSAREAMTSAGVPVTPGTEMLPEDPAAAREIAERAMLRDAKVSPGAASGASAYPILLKAAAGGGGKGMRIVAAPEGFVSAYTQARSEALSSFGDPSVYAERLIRRPRHIEVQVFADTHGNVLHLGERECTIQRRHQKLIEECPSPVVDASTRARIGGLAVLAARAAGYVGAGTCEFLRDEDGSFYFMEMNARLQVEHPVTEMVTGLDLVKLQIRIAAGEKLPFAQDDVSMRGWAIECRIFAEDPARNFLPSPGRIGTLRVPSGPGIRDDGGVYQGYRVPMNYDPMISKLIAWGGSREEAIARMRRALDEYRIEGIRTTIPFHRRVVRHPAFLAGDLDTGFIERYRDELIPGAAARGAAAGGARDVRPGADAQREEGAAGDRPRERRGSAGESRAGRGAAPPIKSAGGAAGQAAVSATGRTAGAAASASADDRSATPSTHSEEPAPSPESPNGGALAISEVAVIAAAIAVFRRAEAGAGAAQGSSNGDGAREGNGGRGAGKGSAFRGRPGGWKIAARLAGLRPR